jgi:hypothetical protein
MDGNQQDETESKLTARLRSWQPKIKQHPVMTAIIIVTSILVTMLIVMIVLGYWFDWSWVGVNGGYSKITTTTSSTGTTTTATEKPPAKNLWDMLQFLILPVVLVVIAYFFNRATARHERAITRDKQHEDALQAYIDKMSELLLDANRPLRQSKPEEEVRKIARVRTLTVLSRLDGKRKRSVLQFLYESGLIDKNNRIVELNGGDFWQADLRWLHLENAHLGGTLCWKVNFSDAFLHGAYLGGVEFREVTWNGADLSGAYLEEAKFLDADGNKYTTEIAIEEQLKEAKSLQGATMPDRSKHP